MPAPCNKTTTSTRALVFRYEVEPADLEIVRDLVAATGKFYVDEVELAVELVEERLNRGPESGYEFVFVHQAQGNFGPFAAGPFAAALDCRTSNQDRLIQEADLSEVLDSDHPSDVGSGSAAKVIGFACYGKIPCTREAYDLYWIAVHPNHQGCGLGRQLLSTVEQSIRAAGGTQLYADTSGRSDYEATLSYYLATGFQQAACLTDFYAPGDNKIIFRKLV